MKQKRIVMVMSTAIVAASLFITPYAHAQETTQDTHPGFFQGLVQFIEQKFGLDKTQVQAAINQYRQQRKATITPRPTLSSDQIQAFEKKRYDMLVQQGKITVAQETAILAELTDLRSKYHPESFKDLSPDQRKTQMQAMLDDLKSWAQSQGIDLNYLLPGFGMGGGKREMMGRRGFGHWANPPSSSMSPTPTQ